MCAVSARLRVKFFYVTASCKMLRVYDISLQVGTLQAIAAEDLRIQVRCGSGVEFRLIGAADHLVLCARRHMVRQQFDLFQLFRIQQPPGCGIKISIRIVDAWDNRDADAKRLSAFLKPLEIFQNWPVGYACICLLYTSPSPRDCS